MGIDDKEYFEELYSDNLEMISESKLLIEKNKVLKDSIAKLKSSFPFINTVINHEQGTSVEDGYVCSFGESKLKYDKGETLYLTDGDNCTISINNKNINLKNMLFSF